MGTQNKIELRDTHDKIFTALCEDQNFISTVYEQAKIENLLRPAHNEFANLSSDEKKELINQIFEKTAEKILSEYPIERPSKFEKANLPSVNRMRSQIDLENTLVFSKEISPVERKNRKIKDLFFDSR